MKGTIKWFSQEKGHGYLIGEDGEEYHIHIKEVKGAVLPTNGDIVEYEPSKNNRGLIAKSLTIIGKRESPNERKNQDERVPCQSCGKKMIPRLVFSRGTATHSVCPFCGDVHKSFGACYIATAAYGSPYASEVDIFRDFRDTVLVNSWLGRTFIAFYYNISPPIANFIAERETLKVVTRKLLLAPLLYFLREKQ